MKTLTEHRGAWFACAFTLASAAVLALSGIALAAGTNTTGTTGTSTTFEAKKVHLTKPTYTDSSTGGSIVRTLIAFLIVVAVIYAIYWLMKQSRAGKSQASGDGLAQIASLPLGTGRSVTLVRVGAELHLLGVTEQNVTGIRVFSEEEAYELGLPMDADGAFGPGDNLPPIQRLVEGLRRFTLR